MNNNQAPIASPTIANQAGSWVGSNFVPSNDSSGAPQTISQANSSSTSTPTTVTSLSTDSAIDTVNQGLGTLNKYSPSTDPNQTTTPTTQTNNGNGPLNQTGNNSNTATSSTTGDTTKPAPAPTASFMNATGQEAEYTQQQLNDPQIQSFIKNGGFQMTKTNGPTYSADGTGAALQNDVTSTDSQIRAIADQFTSYNIDQDPDFQAIAKNITSTYGQLLTQLQTQNASRAAQVDTMGLRDGTTQYAGGIQFALAGSELSAANSRLAELTTKEADAITSARTAYQNGKFSQFNDHINALEKVRDDKLAELKDYNTNVSAILKNFQDTQLKSDQDTAIANIFATGVTDIPGILSKLKEAGVKNVDAKTVGDALSSFAEHTGLGDIKNLSGEVKNFAVLQQAGALPGTIASLPKDKQMGAYLQYMKSINAKVTGGVTSGGGSISKSDIATGAQALESSKGSDGYVDPDLYQSMYNQWTANKLLPQDFTKYYPPKLYVNPANTTLPSYLRSSTAKAKDDTSSQIDQLGALLGGGDTSSTSDTSAPTPKPARIYNFERINR